jgi:hypothetical protein
MGANIASPQKWRQRWQQKYRDKVGEPNPSDQNQGQIDLKLLGAVDPQFAAAQSLDALLHPQQ